ncbi:MAG TPA: DUF2628 domain-containing protein [Alphaproteobacteria bacterium]|nr:DUF2628 domain-containing protein [Alphaproteobacteria bacterium]
MANINEADFIKFISSKPGEAYNSEKVTQYYLDEFRKHQKGNKFNWAAFFFGGLWFFYRKMYLYGFLILALGYLFYFLLPIFAFSDQTSLVNILIINGLLSLFIRITCGFIGTPLYIKFAEQKIAAGYKESGASFQVAILISFFISFMDLAINYVVKGVTFGSNTFLVEKYTFFLQNLLNVTNNQ